VRLGFWQLSRLHEKQRLNAAYRAALATTPVPLPGALAPLAPFAGRRVRATGVYDETRQVLLSGRSLGHSPGVEVVTPLRTPDGGAVLVDRGWLPADDAMHARPQACREPGERTVPGLLEPMPDGVGGIAWTAIAADGVALWSARRLDVDSLRARLPYPIAPYVLRALPDRAAPAQPIRSLPEAPNEMMHLSYAVQWFLFAVILVVGSLITARRGTRSRTHAPDAMPEMPRH
jgi:surfeit locus 1 family protein